MTHLYVLVLVAALAAAPCATLGLSSSVSSSTRIPQDASCGWSQKCRSQLGTSGSSGSVGSVDGLVMRVSKRKSKTSGIGGSEVMRVNNERRTTAGRRGTKNFVDPTKLFVGNLPFDATEEDLLTFFVKALGTSFNIESIKVIRDWKTGDSKGYGFVQFMDPIHATSSLSLVKNQKLKGRILKLSQGQRKKEDPTVMIKKTKLSDIKDEQDQVIYDALTDATSDQGEELDGDDDGEPMDLEDMLAADDSILFLDDDDDDDDFEYDGVFEEIYSKHQTREPLTEEEAAMNRQNRREASKKKKRQKLPHKGFA